MRTHSALSCIVLSALVIACGSDGGSGDDTPVADVTPAPEGQPWSTLGEWGLFEDLQAQTPRQGVVLYEPIAPLFSDYTAKRRFIWVPAGEQMGYSADEVWDFPRGTILVKTFSYVLDERDPAAGERLLETRLLVREETRWKAHTYVYDEDGSEAGREVAGETIDVSWVDSAGTQRSNAYEVPNTNVCQDCHGEEEAMDSLGVRTRQLDRMQDYGAGPVNQIDHLVEQGMLDAAPADRARLVDPFGDAPLSDRMRSYFDSNCGSCHRPGANADSSFLYLDHDFTDPVSGDPTNWGVCKVPTSAGGAT